MSGVVGPITPGSQQQAARALAHAQVDVASGSVREHDLVDHLQSVATLAARFAASFGPEWARLAGLWHDLGKFRPGFQSYILSVNGLDAHLEGKWRTGSDKTHSAAGALFALDEFERRFGPRGRMMARVLAYVIAGHHAGLADWVAGLDVRLLGSGGPDSRRERDEALAACGDLVHDLLALPADFDLNTAASHIPGARSDNPLFASFWIRMLFSALCDADFLDTERFMDADRSDRRSGYPSIAEYRRTLDAHLDAMAVRVAEGGRADDVVMRARALVLRQCREKALLPRGVFSLTVPTGGGKTLSSLAFALAHAEAHGLDRVVYAIPYTSIIEQTADVFGEIFGTANIVEHHSQADTDPAQETPRSRLACENWDAPLVVTTNVQLFESMFAARTSRCRKLHRLANSVIVLDEAQLLPPPFLQPILDALNLLVRHYGATVLLCTATQPVLTELPRFDPRESLRGLPAPVRIVDREEDLFRDLGRVTIDWPADLHAPESTSRLVERLAMEDCVLVIVNTRKDAAEIVAALDAETGDEALHLSAAMCGQHRADVIREIRRHLADRRSGADPRPLRVVSTQLVEAGVDIDFPVVYRAFAGLDSIAQAAGRCNREGLLGAGNGRVVVFVREVPKALEQVRFGTDAARSVLATGSGDALLPGSFARYFPMYYAAFPSRDKHGIGNLLRNDRDLAFGFRSAAERFKLVDDANQASVIVPYASTLPSATNVVPLIERLRSGDTDRWLMRTLQRFTVTAPRRLVERWLQLGDVAELQTNTYALTDVLRYDRRFGLLPDGALPTPEALVA
jgi:CRISPR-associated endonuclease/helicase Cas3